MRRSSILAAGVFALTVAASTPPRAQGHFPSEWQRNTRMSVSGCSGSVGLDRAMSAQQLADLIAYLKSAERQQR